MSLRVSVITPASTAFEGEADQVVAPAWDGEMGILAGHAPMMALLGEGELRVRSGGTTSRFRIARGFLQVVEDVVSIMTEEAAPA
jgi:F-type H+-transporting ATPase subunit epsilon